MYKKLMHIATANEIDKFFSAQLINTAKLYTIKTCMEQLYRQ